MTRLGHILFRYRNALFPFAVGHAHDYRVFFETMLAVTVVAWLLAWGLKRSHVIVAD